MIIQGRIHGCNNIIDSKQERNLSQMKESKFGVGNPGYYMQKRNETEPRTPKPKLNCLLKLTLNPGFLTFSPPRSFSPSLLLTVFFKRWGRGLFIAKASARSYIEVQYSDEKGKTIPSPTLLPWQHTWAFLRRENHSRRPSFVVLWMKS